jgi:Protein of unknown function (DUF3592)
VFIHAAWHRVAVAGLTSVLCAGGVAWAAPDFSKSEILTSSESPLEGDVVTFTLVLRNSGPDDAGAVSLSVEWPRMGFLIDADGFDGPQIDHEARQITNDFPLAAGGERRFVVRVLAPRDSGGDALILAARAAHYASNTLHWVRSTLTIDTRVPTTGIMVAGFRILPAGVAVLVWLMMGVLLSLIAMALSRPGRTRPRAGASARFSIGSLVASRAGPLGSVAAVMVALGFLMIFGTMAWRDYQSLTRWPQTSCTIVGGRLSAQTTTRSPSRTGQDTTNYVPVLGLRYEANGRETFSSGYDTGSRLGIGGQGGRTKELTEWTIGSAVPCWYNPDDPLDVVVLKGFGGAYLFALIPLPVFLLGAAGLWRALA